MGSQIYLPWIKSMHGKLVSWLVVQTKPYMDTQEKYSTDSHTNN